MQLFPLNLRQACTFATVALFSSATSASIQINGTRVIYLSDATNVTLQVKNVGSSTVLLQNWIDNGDADAQPETIATPILLSPAINQLEPGKSQTLRFSYTGNTLPMNQESLFWLNVLEIPSKNRSEADAQHPQIAFRNRIKLFYRPVGLPGDANEAAKAIAWSTQGQSVQANNPTPYYVSFANLSVNGQKLEGTLVPPHSTRILKLPGRAGHQISGSFVNDYGSVIPFSAAIK
ncbi:MULTISPECIES: molecular chaperone [unclassified Serratia (in: enterobacteria)]|uniref:fimbrial biogenesis chaperone n=1 Tax=unclassified Serratia (in: enterobacteria) TaxID=2647522 RepID=UPI000689804A|nr:MULTISPECIES: fimbria/pilus periplasmic chaperone [unclassified Serratia (in: enterobacteria)]